MTTPHRIVNPETLAPAVGFAHAVVARSGEVVFLGGQGPLDRSGRVVGETILEQFERTVENVAEALRAAGAEPAHLVSVEIFVTDVEEYKSAAEEIGIVYRRHLGRHYPAMALFEVSRMFDEKARVEVVCTAVIPR